MSNNPFDDRFRQLGPPPGRPPGILARIAGGVVMAAVFVAAAMFSAVLFAIVLTVGFLTGAWIWWRTRELRRLMREQVEAAGGQRGPVSQRSGGVIIEGETVPVEPDQTSRKASPD